ncbi:cyclin-F [Orycteropus afer afer]|uniref:Cyclin-F n=1 Tax=Orycteropus afer afer TaxID=1230840 RepID=A0A8B6ZQ76_ORYAF|nr:cyclin-F [Orycteropus afer afer]
MGGQVLEQSAGPAGGIPRTGHPASSFRDWTEGWEEAVVHCRCAKCFCYPTRRRIRKRPRKLTILNLPEDVLFQILKWLPVGDVLAVRAVHSRLKYLVDNHASVWACASFQELWPSPRNLELFERAAEKGNFEAAVKLGIAYLYNEGLSVSDEARAEVNGLKASRYFSLAERLNVGATPFIWLFIRPPWSASGSCCKAVVHGSLSADCQLRRTHRASILHCLGRVLSCFEVSGLVITQARDEERQQQALALFAESAGQGCLPSAYLLWEHEQKWAVGGRRQCPILEGASTASGSSGTARPEGAGKRRTQQSLQVDGVLGTEGQREGGGPQWEGLTQGPRLILSLAKACAHGSQLGLEQKACSDAVCQLFQASRPAGKQRIFSVQKGLNDTMRYILIDWLVEVATMKDFTSLCLHLTVECVDRYLQRRPVPRHQLQLLGIACMVICTRQPERLCARSHSGKPHLGMCLIDAVAGGCRRPTDRTDTVLGLRFISKEILTIREAVWLTDNTYKYEDLVRMMGEIVSALEGKIRIPTVVDYKEVLMALVPVARRTQHLCSLLCELSLLHTGLSAYAPAHLAAAALLLARLTHRQTQAWPPRLWDLTGFSYDDLVPCVLSLHKKCFHDDAPKDYRQVSLTAVKQRFEDKRYEGISQEEVIGYSQLCALLGVQQEDPEPAVLFSEGEVHAFLTSPSGRRTKRKRENSLHDRGSFVTTPTAELSSQEDTLLGSFLDWSLDYCSGYEGDQESEGEKEGDVTAPSGVLDVTVVCLNPEQHCCQESSDEEACSEEGALQRPLATMPRPQTPESPGPESPPCGRPGPGRDTSTSGYSSVSSSQSPTSCGDGGPPRPTSAPSPGSGAHPHPCRCHGRKSCLQCCSPEPPESGGPRQLAKRKHTAEHGGGSGTAGLPTL